jgi:dipeptidase E
VQTLILGSDRFDRLPELLGQAPAQTPVAYVPTAADVLRPDDAPYLLEEPRALADMGFPVSVLPLAGASREAVAAALSRARLVFVTGGNPFYLLHHARLAGFTQLVPPLVRSAALTYVGLSAGAHLATPDLLPAVSPQSRDKAPGLATTKAMGLVPFSVLAHHGDPARAARHRDLLRAPQPRAVVPVTDEQLIVVRGEQWRLVSALY